LGTPTPCLDPKSSVLFWSELFKIAGGKIQEIRAVQLDRRHDAVIGWPR